MADWAQGRLSGHINLAEVLAEHPADVRQDDWGEVLLGGNLLAIE